MAGQYLSESVLMSFLSISSGVAVAYLLLPTFNSMTGREFSFATGSGHIALFLVGLALLIGVAAGSYPSIIMSRFEPVVALNDRIAVGGKGALGRILIFLQFGLSTFLIVGAFVSTRQLEFLQTKPLGIRVEQIVTVKGLGFSKEERGKAGVYLELLKATPGVVSAAGIGHYLTNQMQAWTTIPTEDGREPKVQNINVGPGLFETLDMKLLAGRSFSVEKDAMSSNIMVNEEFSRQLNLTVSQELKTGAHSRQVVGVVKDFHVQSLHHKIEPAILTMASYFNQFIVRIRPDNVAETLASLEASWKELSTSRSFSYSFLDDEVDRQYREEERWTRMVRYAASLAIFIACLGAFGLTALAAGRRKKELGIRKVLGARTRHIATLLGRDFLFQVPLAALVAWIGSYYATEKWLASFPYRITLTPDLFLLSSLLTVLVVVAAISAHIYRAAHSDPIVALRRE